MFKAITVVAAIALLSFTLPFAGSYKIDNVHSRFGFSVTHMSIATFNGSFKDYKLTINAPGADFENATVDLTAEIASIDTDNGQRDEHLKGADFFDAAKFPQLTFKSTSFKKVADKKYKVVGDLTLHGVTKKVELDAVHVGNAVNPQSKKEMVGFKVTGVIKRSDFGIATGFPTAALADEVSLNGDFEFTKD
ncbi:YceI family protein [Paraflavitalea sp. CAU 1676]|uniref:YceI family protein n=1 Tax=Paraflavitalea sp. CAU 1676 TaxID=3032598 RepID=UPI0023DA8B9E|nr:YceI family protein [Paraflavitalea sp. CAU 1676]MDF2192434.1 YceI family protein [Paraflavitalea sp. CAU 1676]